MAARDPVITGVGIVAAPGDDLEDIWQALAKGASGLSPLSLFASPRYGQVPVGEIQRDLVALGAPLRASRSDRLGWLAARDAIRSARLDLVSGGDRTGLILGCSVGGSLGCEGFLSTLIKQRKMRPRPTRFYECASAVDLIADDFGLFGPCLAVATACSSGALAIATAAEMIQAGEADVMLAGGADSLSRMTWGGFHSLLLVDETGCRPFDRTRGGMSLGEGAAILILEAEESARQRGATILARLSGWGTSCDAHHATAPHPEGAGALAAMQAALRRAGLPTSAIDYVNAHGTGTRDNDLAESKALKSLFGESVPPFSSTKRTFGHALAASGAIEAVVCIEALRRQLLPPNAGFAEADPALGLQPVTALRPAHLAHAMSNSFGFGGNNAVLIFSTPESTPNTRSPQAGSVSITGLGVIGPGAVTVREIEPPLPPGSVSAHSCGPLTDAALLSPNQRRRLSRIIQMGILAARRSHAPAPGLRVAVAMGTGYGCVEEGAIFLENLIAKDEREPMPSRFPGSVHNAPAAQIAIDLGAHAMNSAPTMGEISFEGALWQGVRQLVTDEADCALVGAVDELNKYPLAVGRRWGFWTEQTRPGEGAMVARLVRDVGPRGNAADGGPATTASLPPHVGDDLARVTAVRLGRYRRPFDARREADWIAATVDLTNVAVFLSGAQGWPVLENAYRSVAAELSARAGRTIEHQTYKQLCGEFHSASAFGFSVAVKLVQKSRSGVLLYTLSPRGSKALCCVQP